MDVRPPRRGGNESPTEARVGSRASSCRPRPGPSGRQQDLARASPGLDTGTPGRSAIVPLPTTEDRPTMRIPRRALTAMLGLSTLLGSLVLPSVATAQGGECGIVTADEVNQALGITDATIQAGSA